MVDIPIFPYELDIPKSPACRTQTSDNPDHFRFQLYGIIGFSVIDDFSIANPYRLAEKSLDDFFLRIFVLIGKPIPRSNSRIRGRSSVSEKIPYIIASLNGKNTM